MMRRLKIVAMLALACVVGARPVTAQKRGTSPSLDTTATWYRRQREWLAGGTAYTDTPLRAALLALPSRDAAATQGALLGFELNDVSARPLAPQDTAMVRQLLGLAANRGSRWPTRSVVGADGVLAVWTLATRDTALARAALKRMMEAGPEESPPAAVALLEDRMRARSGRKQLYGTQLSRMSTGDVTPLPIEDVAHLALRRDGAELPPLEQSLCAARTAARAVQSGRGRP
jgi:hypothetical protein